MPPLYKCVVLGFSQAGKTSLLRTLIDKTFYGEPHSGAYALYTAQATAFNGSSMDLQLWDTSGLASNDYISRLYYPNTDVFIICFSLADDGSLEQIAERWLTDIRMCCPTAPIVLVGTKADLREDEQYLHARHLCGISYVEGLEMAQEIGAVEYVECSALRGIGVAAVFDAVAACVQNNRTQPEVIVSETIMTEEIQQREKKKSKKCCLM